MTKGRISREEYLDRSLSRQQPWLIENISRRTWERRRRLQNRDASPTQAVSPDRAAVASPFDDASEARLAEARAQVEKIYAKMAEEHERRWQWWIKPVDDSPDRIELRNIVCDETVTIRLDGDAKRERKQPAPTSRMWWDDPT